LKSHEVLELLEEDKTYDVSRLVYDVKSFE